MATEYTWKGRGNRSSFRLPQSQNGSRWVFLAVVFAVLLHTVAFFAAKRIPVILGLSTDNETQVDYMNVQRVETVPMVDYEAPKDQLLEPLKDSAALLEEIDALESLPDDFELDVSPSIEDPQFSLKMEVPALSGEVLSEMLESSKGAEIETNLPELGRLEDIFNESQTGRIVIEKGEAKADEFDPDAFTSDLLRKGQDTLNDDGVLANFTDLDALLNMPSGSLVDKKAMIGSDLLFEFGSDQLRQSARFSLMKVAMLIDKNPEMFCWIEGHTDSIGGLESNVELSQRRADSVKQWLIKSLGMSEGKIIARAFGESQLIVKDGDAEIQAANRRVEIKMRKMLPPKPEELNAPKAILVKPKVPYSKAEEIVKSRAELVDEPDESVATPEPPSVEVQESDQNVKLLSESEEARPLTLPEDDSEDAVEVKEVLDDVTAPEVSEPEEVKLAPVEIDDDDLAEDTAAIVGADEVEPSRAVIVDEDELENAVQAERVNIVPAERVTDEVDELSP